MDLESFTTEQLISLFKRRSVPQEALDSLRDNDIDGSSLLLLRDDADEFKAVVPKSGHRLLIKRIIKEELTKVDLEAQVSRDDADEFEGVVPKSGHRLLIKRIIKEELTKVDLEAQTQMGDIEKKTRDQVKTLGQQLKEMYVDMRFFSLTLRSLYVEKAVGTNMELAIKFRKLRDDTRNDAMVYLKGVLPFSTKFVSSISEYFEYYEALEYKEWCDVINDILEETVGYRQLCEVLLKMHEDILESLKKRKDQAMLVITEFKELTEEFEKQKEILEAKASTKRIWAWGLCWIPGVNLIATPLLHAGADADLAKAVAKSKQANIAEVASITVATTLIPALAAFIDGIRKAAGFFSVMEQELRKFEGNAGKADPKKLYYKVMNKEAKDMKSICQMFFAVLPDVRTDFLTIPTEGTNQNYVDKWLEKQKQTIREKCKVPKVVKKWLIPITGWDYLSI